MIRPSGGRGPGFDSRLSPRPFFVFLFSSFSFLFSFSSFSLFLFSFFLFSFSFPLVPLFLFSFFFLRKFFFFFSSFSLFLFTCVVLVVRVWDWFTCVVLVVRVWDWLGRPCPPLDSHAYVHIHIPGKGSNGFHILSPT